MLEWKTSAAMMFSASVALCAVILFITGESAMPISILASLLIVSMAGAFMQFLAFTGRIIKKMRYTARVLVFAAPFFAILAGNAWFFRWFPVDGAVHWLMPVSIFFTVFVGGTIAFEIYYRAMGKKYDGLLGEYRRERESEKRRGI